MDAWEKHSLDQLLYFRSLSLREKMKAVEGMADVVRHFRRMRAEGRFHAVSARKGRGKPDKKGKSRQKKGDQ